MYHYQYSISRLHLVGVIAFLILAVVIANVTDGCSGEATIYNSNQNDLSYDAKVAQAIASYELEVAKKFAPLLLFDKEQGWDGDWQCFPMDAGVYWDLRHSGNRDRICSEDSSTISVGGSNLPTGDPAPAYYIYQKCFEKRAIGAINGEAGETCVPLHAGKSVEVGTVCAELIETGIRITYTTMENWKITEAHLWSGQNLVDIPGTRKGNPKIGHFPYKIENDTGISTCSLDIALSELDTVVYLAAHAQVYKNSENGTSESEGAWAFGPRIVEKGNWATCFSIDIDIIAKTEYVMYWFFYGWQDYCSPGIGAHHADWERVVVKVVNGMLDRVMYFQHSGWYTREPGNYEVVGTHPLVYVGKNNHGSYHDDGGTGTCCYFEDFRKPGPWGTSLKMMTWLNLNELTSDENSPEWMKYRGEWGGENMDNGIWSPLSQAFCDDLCNIPGCKGNDDWPGCVVGDICGCFKSDIGDDEIF